MNFAYLITEAVISYHVVYFLNQYHFDSKAVVPYFHNTEVKPYLNMFHDFQKERMGTVTSYSEIC